MPTPMTVEICVTCGCSEFSHHVRECDERCPEDCWGDAEDHTECECGRCDDYGWLSGEPDELVCELCGNGCLDPDMVECCDCDGEGQDITAAQFVISQLHGNRRNAAGEAARRPVAIVGDRVTVDWTDEPLRLAGALVADEHGQPVRRDGVPATDDEVFVYFALGDDGTELAITRNEISYGLDDLLDRATRHCVDENAERD